MLSYQETDDGIKIKGRKFSFDGTMKLVAEETESDTQEQLLNEQQKPSVVKSVLSPVATLHPLRFEVFDPIEAPPPGTVGSLGKGWKFTKGQRYPIYQEKPAGTSPLLGMLYITMDDDEKRREISDKYFVIPPRLDERFLEDGKQYVGATGPEPKLSFGTGTLSTSDMPDLSTLRRKR
jgi:hypothetical protein